MAKQYDVDAATAAYDETQAHATAGEFWAAVAVRLGRGGSGVYAKLEREWGWAPKLTRRTRCGVCGERFTWQAFHLGGRQRVCIECVARVTVDATEGRR